MTTNIPAVFADAIVFPTAPDEGEFRTAKRTKYRKHIPAVFADAIVFEPMKQDEGDAVQGNEMSERDEIFAALVEANVRTAVVEVEHVEYRTENCSDCETDLSIFAYRGTENEHPIELSTVLVTALKDVCQGYFDDALEKMEWAVERAFGAFIFDTTHKTIKLSVEAEALQTIDLKEAFEF